MAAFEYVALDPKGKQKKGILEADSPRQIRQQLRDKGWTPLSVEETVQKQKKGSFFSGKGPSITVMELALLTRQIATLIAAGLPIEEALRALSEQTEKAKVKSMVLAIRSKVLEGYTFANSLAEFPQAFPKLYIATVSAGETAGHLHLVLDKLADYTESSHEAQSKIKMAAVYPIILTVVSLGIVIALLTFVVPDIVEVFVNNGQELPPLTQVMLNISGAITNYGHYIGIGLLSIFILFSQALKRPKFKLSFHKMLLTAPFIGNFVTGANAARYTSTLSILNSSGVPLVEAMRIAAQVLSNEYMRGDVAEAAIKVSEGASLNAALKQCGYFPPMMLHMIASGEKSGELGEMLERTSRNQENMLQAKISTMVGLFEPMMLLVMGGVVILIVMAIMLPILNLNQLVG